MPHRNKVLRHYDEYASYVLNRGHQHELGNSIRQQIASAVSNSVRASRRHLIDPYTSLAIESTIINALYQSRAFQDIVAFGLYVENTNLGDIRYQNTYELNPENTNITNITDIQEITYNDIQDANIDTLPIIMITELRDFTDDEEDDDRLVCVNISPAPNQDSAEYPFWQEALIHEITHHITSSEDPWSEAATRLGPTEILARQVANEMDWPIPQFAGYRTPARHTAIRQRDFRALFDTLNRLPEHRDQVMDRLTAIADGDEVSEDFSELEQAGGNLVYDLPLPDISSDLSSSSLGSFFFPGASAASPKPATRVWSLDSRTCAKNKHIMFNDKQLLTQRDIEVLSLVIAERAVNRAINGGGFRKKDYESWKTWYQKSDWKPVLPFGLYDYGLDEAKGNDIFNPYGIIFNDGSFSVGVTGEDVKYGPRDNWTTLAGSNWGQRHAGQIFFDKSGRPVAIVITNNITGFFGSGWSFIYNNGRWEYESKDDWDERRFPERTESLDPYAAKFLI